MRRSPSSEVEKGRIREGHYGSDENYKCNGAFIVRSPYDASALLAIIASSGREKSTSKEERGWEHVSVSTKHRTPTWDEMEWIKQQFWEPYEVCWQIHPAKNEYVNNHPFCLHIWRHRYKEIPKPPKIFVGVR